MHVAQIGKRLRLAQRVPQRPAQLQAFAVKRHRLLVIPKPGRDQPQIVQRPRDPFVVAQRPAQRQRLIVVLTRGTVLADVAQEIAERVVGIRARDRVRVAGPGPGEGALQPVPPLRQPTPRRPVAPQRAGERQPGTRCASCSIVQDNAASQIRILGVETLQPRHLIGPNETGVRPLGQIAVKARVRLVDGGSSGSFARNRSPANSRIVSSIEKRGSGPLPLG